MPVQSSQRVRVVALGMSPGLCPAVASVPHAGFDFLFPAQAMDQSWFRLLPDFAWPSVFLGPGERFANGCYVALVVAASGNFTAADNSWADRWR